MQHIARITQEHSQDLQLEGAVLVIGQVRGRRPQTWHFAPRGKSLGRVSIPNFGGSGYYPEKCVQICTF
jgi:hypothetical protein